MNILDIRIVFDRRGETKNNPKKVASVHIEVLERESKRKKYFHTGVKILANQYSATGGFSVKNHPNALILKTKVLSVYNKIEAFIHSDKCTCLDDVANWDNNITNITFLYFFKQELDKKAIKDVTGNNVDNARFLALYDKSYMRLFFCKKQGQNLIVL